jgi:hypothetical protein
MLYTKIIKRKSKNCLQFFLDAKLDHQANNQKVERIQKCELLHFLHGKRLPEL